MKTKTHNKRRGARISTQTLALGCAMMAASCGYSLAGTVISDDAACPQEVLKEAQDIFDARITRVGDKYYTVRVVCGYDPTPIMEGAMKAMMGEEFDLKAERQQLLLVKMQLIEMKDLSTKVTAYPLSDADKLNGITWKGSVDVGANVERRRILDLMPTLEKVIAADGAVEIPWTEKKLKWLALPGEMLSTSDKSGAELAATPEIPDLEKDIAHVNGAEIIANLFYPLGFEISKGVLEKTPALRALLNMVDEAIVEGFRGGEWCDWTDGTGNSYQNSKISVKNGTVESKTIESSEDSTTGDVFYFHASDKSKPGISIIGRLLEGAARDGGANTVFLLKPDMEALREAGIVE